MIQAFVEGILFGLIVGLLFACGETVNYETRAKLVTPTELNSSPSASEPSSANDEVNLPGPDTV